MFDDIKNCKVKFYDIHSPAVRDLVESLLKKDPAQRLCNPEQMMKHDFFKGIDWDLLLKRQC